MERVVPSYVIRRSVYKRKKYDAVFSNGKVVPFGQLGYDHYKDRTPLKLYSHLDHLDDKRRASFRARFKSLYNRNKNNPYSAIRYSMEYLW